MPFSPCINETCLRMQVLLQHHSPASCSSCPLEKFHPCRFCLSFQHQWWDNSNETSVLHTETLKENTKCYFSLLIQGPFFSWNSNNVISAARAGIWSSEQRSHLLHLLLHDLFLCFFNSSPAFSDFWHTGWWHLAHTLPQWFNFCISVSFKKRFCLAC